jgi:hypothetical protein
MGGGVLCFFLVMSVCRGVSVAFIDNTAPRRDLNNEIMDAHDGSVQRFPSAAGAGAAFWMHTLSYGLCVAPTPLGCDKTTDHCGFQLDHNVSIYTSPDLTSWSYVGLAFPRESRPPGTLFRPSVVWNRAARQFVMWVNFVNESVNLHGYAALVAATPLGPFELAVPAVNLTNATKGGDYQIFVDDDATAYVIYSSLHWMAVEELTPDYLASTGRTSGIFGPYFVEAPIMFKRAGVYYSMFGHCCCFCAQGSGGYVYTAPAPLGPWTLQAPAAEADVVCAPPPPPSAARGAGSPTPGQGCLYNGSDEVAVTKSQASYVVRVPTPNGTVLLWAGDRWGQSPDGLKGHEPQYWAPLAFLSDGRVKHVEWVDNFTLTIE